MQWWHQCYKTKQCGFTFLPLDKKVSKSFKFTPLVGKSLVGKMFNSKTLKKVNFYNKTVILLLILMI
jgi:hypothetical protein